jgi:phospholipid/cholesterol/gamma-HCH transport system substrate-binding protein
MIARRIALVALCGVILAVGAIVILGGSDDSYIVKAEFNDAGGVRKNSDVKIGEVPAGRVIGVDLTKADTAIVTMKLDDGVGPVGQGALARSRPVNLLGEKFVELDLGDTRKPIPSRATIPASRTTTSVELDDILNTLQPDIRARLRILINEAGIAMAGRGADFNGMLEQMPEGLEESATFLGALSSDTHKLAGLVEKGDRVLAAVAGRRTDLGRLVDSADAALGVVASRRAALGRTVVSAPSGLAQLRATLGELEQAGSDLRPAAANLRATSAPLASTLRRLPAFAKDTRQTLAEATRVAPALARLGTDATPTVRRLRPTLRHFADVTNALAPLTKELADNSVRELLRFANNWTGLTTLQDGVSHIFRVRLLLGPDALTGEGAPRTPQVRAKRRKRPPATAAPGAALPASPAAKPSGNLLPQLPRPLTDALDGVDAAVKQVLGGEPKVTLEGLLQGAGAGTRDDSSSNVLKLIDDLIGN